MAFVEITGLTKSYPVSGTRLEVLRGLELSVAPGEMVAIVGASGVGKSTLMHVVGGLDQIDGGRIRVGETEVVSGGALLDDLARALVNRPSLLLADEPTGDLDEQTGEALHRLLREMHQRHGLTSLIATHNLRLAAACDRILRLENGGLRPA